MTAAPIESKRATPSKPITLGFVGDVMLGRAGGDLT